MLAIYKEKGNYLFWNLYDGDLKKIVTGQTVTKATGLFKQGNWKYHLQESTCELRQDAIYLDKVFAIETL